MASTLNSLKATFSFIAGDTATERNFEAAAGQAAFYWDAADGVKQQDIRFTPTLVAGELPNNATYVLGELVLSAAATDDTDDKFRITLNLEVRLDGLTHKAPVELEVGVTSGAMTASLGTVVPFTVSHELLELQVLGISFLTTDTTYSSSVTAPPGIAQRSLLYAKVIATPGEGASGVSNAEIFRNVDCPTEKDPDEPALPIVGPVVPPLPPLPVCVLPPVPVLPAPVAPVVPVIPPPPPTEGADPCIPAFWVTYETRLGCLPTGLIVRPFGACGFWLHFIIYYCPPPESDCCLFVWCDGAWQIKETPGIKSLTARAARGFVRIPDEDDGTVRDGFDCCTGNYYWVAIEWEQNGFAAPKCWMAIGLLEVFIDAKSYKVYEGCTVEGQDELITAATTAGLEYITGGPGQFSASDVPNGEFTGSGARPVCNCSADKLCCDTSNGDCERLATLLGRELTLDDRCEDLGRVQVADCADCNTSLSGPCDDSTPSTAGSYPGQTLLICPCDSTATAPPVDCCTSTNYYIITDIPPTSLIISDMCWQYAGEYGNDASFFGYEGCTQGGYDEIIAQLGFPSILEVDGPGAAELPVVYSGRNLVRAVDAIDCMCDDDPCCTGMTYYAVVYTETQTAFTNIPDCWISVGYHVWGPINDPTKYVEQIFEGCTDACDEITTKALQAGYASMCGEGSYTGIFCRHAEPNCACGAAATIPACPSSTTMPASTTTGCIRTGECIAVTAVETVDPSSAPSEPTFSPPVASLSDGSSLLLHSHAVCPAHPNRPGGHHHHLWVIESCDTLADLTILQSWAAATETGQWGIDAGACGSALSAENIDQLEYNVLTSTCGDGSPTPITRLEGLNDIGNCPCT